MEEKAPVPNSFLWTLAIFAVLWAGFYGLYRKLPYVKNGSDVVFNRQAALGTRWAGLPYRFFHHAGPDFRQ